MFQMSLTSLGLLWRNLLKAPRCQWAQNTPGSCCRTRCSCSPEAAGPRQQIVWTSAMIQSQNPLRFSSLFSHPPLNEIKILTKPTGAIKASVKAGKRKQELQETLRGWRCRNWRCWGQGSSTGSPIQPTELWNPWAEQLPSFPWAPPGALPVAKGQRSHKSCGEQKCSKIQTALHFWGLLLFQTRTKSLKSWDSLKTMDYFFG